MQGKEKEYREEVRRNPSSRRLLPLPGFMRGEERHGDLKDQRLIFCMGKNGHAKTARGTWPCDWGKSRGGEKVLGLRTHYSHKGNVACEGRQGGEGASALFSSSCQTEEQGKWETEHRLRFKVPR